MNEKPEDLAGVMRRIEKLLAIAGDSRANPNEAASAAGMAERIMRKYQIEHAEVIATSLKAGVDLDSIDVIATAKTNGSPVLRTAPWAGWIAVKVATLNECGARAGFTPDGEACVRFFGLHADVKVAAWTFGYLVATVNRLCAAFRQTEAYAAGGRRTLNSYRQGLAIGVMRALDALTAAPPVVVSDGTSLVILKQHAIAEKFGKITYVSRGTKVARGDAFAVGVADGRKIDVSRKAVGSQPIGRLQ